MDEPGDIRVDAGALDLDVRLGAVVRQLHIELSVHVRGATLQMFSSPTMGRDHAAPVFGGRRRRIEVVVVLVESVVARHRVEVAGEAKVPGVLGEHEDIRGDLDDSSCVPNHPGARQLDA